ncbi:B12-binding domain-containing radical SAM protein [Chloroflexota bacterium]
MKVLCIYPNLEGYGKVPLGLSLIASCLLREGHNVELFDPTFIGERGHVDESIRKAAGLVVPTDISHLYETHTAEEIDEMLREQVRRFSPDIIAMTMVEDNYRYGDHLLAIVKSMASEIPVIVGGSTPTSVPDIVIENPHIDYVCQGEGEEAIVEFCDLMRHGKSVENVRNLWYKKNGMVRSNPLRPFIDMNTLPIQCLELWDKRHFIKPYTGRLWQAGNFETSRGCLNKCSYCINECLQILHRGFGRFHRGKSISKVIREIKTLKGQYSLEIIFFADDNFLLMSHARFNEFVHAWTSEIRLPYWMNTEFELITEERLAKLKESGCCGIGIGLESGSEWIRSNVLRRRYISNDRIVEKLKLIESFDIRVTANSMIGFPGEYEDDIFETIKLNRKIKPKSLDLNFVAPYAGTAIHAMAKEKGYLETYAEPGFRGMAKDITVRKKPVMELPQITNEQLNDIFYKFTDYVYGNDEFPAQFRKPALGADRRAPPRDSDGRDIITVSRLAEL